MAREGIGSPQAALLGLLVDQPRHGYELYQEFDRGLGRVWSMGKSKLYAHLKELEAAGLVAGRTEPQPNRPARKVYRLTPRGEEAFGIWLHTATPYLRQIRVEFLARLFFFHHLSLPGLGRLVSEQKEVCQAQVERFSRAAAGADDAYRRLVLEFRCGQLESVVRWLDRCLELL